MNNITVDKAKVVLLENIQTEAVDYFESNGFKDITLIKVSPNEETLKTLIKDVNILGIRSKTKIPKEILKLADNLIAMACFSVGHDTVDKQFVEEIGVPVFNAPFANTRSVAELIIGNTISLMRKIPQKNKLCHKGIWSKESNGCFEIRNKTIGIIGYGHIGVQVGILAEALGMKVIYYDIEKKLSIGSATPVNSIEELLKQADIVTLHVPKLNSTANLIGDKEFDLMKNDVIFLNASRGNVVDIKALVKNIKNGKIIGAGIDVFPKEPANKEELFTSELQQFDNVILTPHIGGSTEEGQRGIAIDASEKLINYFLYGKTEGALNFPIINIGNISNNCHRISCIYGTSSNVLKKINLIFNKLNIDIVEEYTQTDSLIGYTIIDFIDKKDSMEDILNKIKFIDNIIKVRLVK